MVIQWSKARFLAAPDDTWFPLWKALGLFIFNGGVDWHLGPDMHWSFFAFLFLLAYNILRVPLTLFPFRQVAQYDRKSRSGGTCGRRAAAAPSMGQGVR